jgi:glutaryl-CoA dehydrogenase (non-decarboxylating)
VTAVSRRRPPDVASWAELCAAEVGPRAYEIEQLGRLPDDLLEQMVRLKVLGAPFPRELGGSGLTPTVCGLLCEEAGRWCTSTRSLLTVQWMVGAALQRWGTEEQRRRWVPRLADGSTIAALALSEPGAGSDAAAIATNVSRHGRDLVLNGRKRWISFGTTADFVLVLATGEDGAVAVVVERGDPGLSVAPINGLLGCRGSDVGDVLLEDCVVPANRVVGRPGSGITHVAGTALDDGRFTVGWGCVGMLAACVEDSSAHATARRQFGVPIADHQLIRRLLTDMGTAAATARLLALEAARLRTAGRANAAAATLMTKYHASTAAARAAADAVQIHGAAGCVAGSRVERFYRDAKVMEIIEGSTQVQQNVIAAHVRAGRLVLGDVGG